VTARRRKLMPLSAAIERELDLAAPRSPAPPPRLTTFEGEPEPITVEDVIERIDVFAAFSLRFMHSIRAELEKGFVGRRARVELCDALEDATRAVESAMNGLGGVA
jgi:hypothetical protein